MCSGVGMRPVKLSITHKHDRRLHTLGVRCRIEAVGRAMDSNGRMRTYFWRRDTERRDVARREAVGLGGIRAGARVDDGRIEIVLPGGRRDHVVAPVDRQALADVLAVLKGHRCQPTAAGRSRTHRPPRGGRSKGAGPICCG